MARKMWQSFCRHDYMQVLRDFDTPRPAEHQTGVPEVPAAVHDAHLFRELGHRVLEAVRPRQAGVDAVFDFVTDPSLQGLRRVARDWGKKQHGSR